MTRQQFTPREYQGLIADHLLDLPRCGIWAGMGLGKTVSTLTALDALFFSGVETKPALVVAPLRVAQSTWPDEAAKWSHLSGIDVQPIIGDAPTRKAALRNRNAAVFTINYENIPWLMETLGGDWPFGPLIADESTKLKGWRGSNQVSKKGVEFVRGAGALRARALAKVAHRKCTRFHQLTGTPSPNGLKDLWGQLWYLDGGERLGRVFKAFEQRWFQRSFDGRSIEPLPFAQDQIQDKVRDICLSLEAKDYFDLKEPIRNLIYIDMPDRARKLYRDMEKQMFLEIEGDPVEAFNAASRTVKCHQLANGAIYLDGREGATLKEWREVHDLKVQALESIIEEAAGAPVLVAYHFNSDLDRLRKAFPKARVLDDKPQTIRDWNKGKIRILLAHPASAGHGLNLQDGGNIIAYFSINWNLENHDQIRERIGPVRQLQAGHERPVFEHYLLARDTVDELILERLETKRQVQDILMDALKRRKK